METNAYSHPDDDDRGKMLAIGSGVQIVVTVILVVLVFLVWFLTVRDSKSLLEDEHKKTEPVPYGQLIVQPNPAPTHYVS